MVCSVLYPSLQMTLGEINAHFEVECDWMFRETSSTPATCTEVRRHTSVSLFNPTVHPPNALLDLLHR